MSRSSEDVGGGRSSGSERAGQRIDRNKVCQDGTPEPATRVQSILVVIARPGREDAPDERRTGQLRDGRIRHP